MSRRNRINLRRRADNEKREEARAKQADKQADKAADKKGAAK